MCCAEELLRAANQLCSEVRGEKRGSQKWPEVCVAPDNPENGTSTPHNPPQLTRSARWNRAVLGAEDSRVYRKRQALSRNQGLGSREPV